MWVCHFVFSIVRSIRSSRDFQWYLLYWVSNCGNYFYFYFLFLFLFFLNCNVQVMSEITFQRHQSPIPFKQEVTFYGCGIQFTVLTIVGFFIFPSSSFFKLILPLESNTLYRGSIHEIVGSGSYLLFFVFFSPSQISLYFLFFS